MLNKIITLLFLLSVSAAGIADEIEVNPDRPDKYVVQKGDTLWSIAGRFLAQPWRWPDIWKGNPQIQDPNLIYPGDVVSLRYEGGVPVLSATPGSGRNVKLSPEVRSYDDPEPIPSIPLSAIQQFLTRPLVLAEDEMSGWPYIVAAYGNHMISGKGSKVYVRGLSGGAGGKYFLYRRGPEYRNASTGDLLGYEALYIGEVEVVKTGEPATAMVTHSAREILEGDRLLAVTKGEISSDFTPRSPKGAVNGNIISMIEGLSEIGQYQVVVLDVGAGSGVEVGNVLGVYQAGLVVKDRVAGGEAAHPAVEYLGDFNVLPDKVALPQEYAGVVMVFRTFPNVSYALVMEATGPLNVNDSVRNL